MSKNADVITRNGVYAARKDKAKALLDKLAKGFNRWNIIRHFIEVGILTSIEKDDPELPYLLSTGYVEIVEPEPCEKELSPNLSSPSRVALQPTEQGIACYFWFMRYNEQCRAKEAAYIQGKKDVALQLFGNIANSVGLDFEQMCEDMADKT